MVKVDTDDIKLNGGLSWSKLVAFATVILASSFSTVVVRDKVVPPRPFAFTSKDAELQKLSILNIIDSKCRGVEQNMPPEYTRDRIRKIEKWIHSNDTAFESASDEWR